MTNNNPIRILLIEDNPGDARLIREILNNARRIETDLTCADCLKKGLECLSEKEIDLLLLDLNLPDSHGLAALDKLARTFPELPVVIMTGLDNEEMGVQAMGAGAQDYIVKGSFEPESLERVIQYALERNTIKQRLKKSETRFKKMIEKNSDGVIIVDKEGFIRFANTAWEKLSCRTQAEIVGSSFGFPAETEGAAEIDIIRPDRKETTAEIRITNIDWEDEKACLISCRDITERKKLEIERERLITDLEKALDDIKILSGMLPICSYCKKIRDDKGYWGQIETYIENHSDAKFSHSICKECADEHFPDLDIYE